MKTEIEVRDILSSLYARREKIFKLLEFKDKTKYGEEILRTNLFHLNQQIELVEEILK